jgi:hypothetical protein
MGPHLAPRQAPRTPARDRRFVPGNTDMKRWCA